MSAYEIKINDYHAGYVEADNVRQAKKYARAKVECRELSVREVIALTQDGKAITNIADVGVTPEGEQQ